MGKLTGLSETSRDIEALFINEGADIRVILMNEYAATSAGQKGAINVWKDDNGVIRAEAMAHFRTLESKRFSKMHYAIKWTDKWLKRIV